MGHSQSKSSGKDQLPCLGILIPEPLLEECNLLRDEFDELPMGVRMEATKLHRLKYLLNLTRLPLDETIRAQYRKRVGIALKFRQDYEFLRGWLLTNGDSDLDGGTLEAIERQRQYFGPNDDVLECAIRQSLHSRRNTTAGESPDGPGTNQNQESEGTTLSTARRQAPSSATIRRRRQFRWGKGTPKTSSNLEMILEASGEDDDNDDEEDGDQR